MIDGHGDDLYRYPGRNPVNFSSNILGGVSHDGLMRHLARLATLPSAYPDPTAHTLALRLGEEGTVEVTAGATEAIYLIAMSRRGARSAILGPTFREYEDACRLHAHTVTHVTTLGATYGHDVIWICNPNNPTGTVIPKEELLSAISRNPGSLYVIDQAYAPYTVRPLITDAEAVEAGNVILLSSLTKRFSVPGLRVGYAVGAPGVIDTIRSMRMPWSVNSLAIEGAMWLLDHQDEYVIDAPALNGMALDMAGGLRRLGIWTSETECNFVLCRLPGTLRAADLKGWLMEEADILIRDASNFTGLTPAHFRLAAQTPQSDKQLISQIARWMSLSRS